MLFVLNLQAGLLEQHEVDEVIAKEFNPVRYMQWQTWQVLAVAKRVRCLQWQNMAGACSGKAWQVLAVAKHGRCLQWPDIKDQFRVQA